MNLFGAEVAMFFSGLQADNSREWFTTHREQYDNAIKAPLERLLAEAEPVYGPGRVMRPNRDVRFSTNKSPYKTNASLSAGTIGGVYLQVDARGIQVGGGLYEPTRDQLGRGRDAIATRPRAAAELASTIAHLEADGYEIAGPSLKTAPRGYSPDHAEIALLRLKHYAALRHLPLTASHDQITDSWAQVKGLIEWASTHVGSALSWP